LFDARLNQNQKILIQKAADLEGPISCCIARKRLAERAIRDRTLLMLTARETEAFVDAILKPRPPTLLGRLAVSQTCRVVDAISDGARSFYEHHEFIPPAVTRTGYSWQWGRSLGCFRPDRQIFSNNRNV
jgi:uncharacterized protein (DUF1778 family)